MAVRPRKKPNRKVDRRLQAEALKADVTRLRSTAQLVVKAHDRAEFLTDAKLRKRILERLEGVAELCGEEAAKKVEEAKALSLADIEEELGSYEGNKGTRRLER